MTDYENLYKKIENLTVTDLVVSQTMLGLLQQPKNQKLIGSSHRPKRNKECPCSSGKKYKHCCIGHETNTPRKQYDS